LVKHIHFTRSPFGGSGAYALRLVDSLKNAGSPGEVFFLEAQDTADKIGTKTGRFTVFYNRLSRSFLGRASAAPYHSLLLTRSAVKWNFSSDALLHFHGINGALGLLQLRNSLAKSTPVFWTIHDMWPLTGGCLVYRGCDHFQGACQACPALKNPFRFLAMLDLQIKRGLFKGSRVQPIANSSWTAHKISESAVFQDVEEIPVVHPILSHEFSIADNAYSMESSINARFKIALGARSVTDEFKGIPQFLDALAARPALASKVEIVIFGDGTLRIPSGLVVDQVGKIEGEREIARLYQAVDCFISPSRMETFGMAIAEAQACGCRVLAFDVGGVVDAFHTEAGALVRDGDWGAMLEALENEVEQADVFSEARSRVSREIRVKFSPEKIAGQQLAIYKRHFQNKIYKH
jgi:glycosyltransferase involved in cell wall biosynthesis